MHQSSSRQFSTGYFGRQLMLLGKNRFHSKCIHLEYSPDYCFPNKWLKNQQVTFVKIKRTNSHLEVGYFDH